MQDKLPLVQNWTELILSILDEGRPVLIGPRSASPIWIKPSLSILDEALQVYTNASTFSRVAQAGLTLRSLRCFVSLRKVVMLTSTSYVASSSPPHSSLRPGRYPCNLLHDVQFGHLPEQSSITGCEPNDPVEVRSAEVRTTLVQTRGASMIRLATLARASPLPLHHRRWMKNLFREC